MAAVHILAPRHKAFGCGICDHSHLLASHFVQAGARVAIHHATDKGFASEIEVREGDLVLLQLSVYGFQIRGVPAWLPAQLQRIKSQGARLVTYFHELWVQRAGLGSSAFWLAPLQQHICQQVLTLSDRAFFNSEYALNWGRARAPTRCDYFSTFSTIGESAAALPAWRERPKRIVVFGNTLARADVYRALIDAAGGGPAAWQDFELVDIGRSSPDLEALLAPAGPVLRHFGAADKKGMAKPAAIQAALLKSRFGLFATPWHLASKSSIFAAYAAHGVCPVSIYHEAHASWQRRLPPLPQVHYALLQPLMWHNADAEDGSARIAQAARASYRSSGELADVLLQEAAVVEACYVPH